MIEKTVYISQFYIDQLVNQEIDSIDRIIRIERFVEERIAASLKGAGVLVIKIKIKYA